MKKQILNVALGALVIASSMSIQSCKKGENDPGLSLKSRKARLTGEWTLKSMEMTEKSSHNMVSTPNKASTTEKSPDFTTVTKVDNEAVTITITKTTVDTTVTDVKTGTYKCKMNIEKDGTFKFEITKNFVESDDTYTTTTNIVEAIEGLWAFVEGSKELELKDKERVMMQNRKKTITQTVTSSSTAPGSVTSTTTTTSTVTYDGVSGGEYDIRVIDKLSNKEVVLIWENLINTISSTDYPAGSYFNDIVSNSNNSSTGTATYTQE